MIKNIYYPTYNHHEKAIAKKKIKITLHPSTMDKSLRLPPVACMNNKLFPESKKIWCISDLELGKDNIWSWRKRVKKISHNIELSTNDALKARYFTLRRPRKWVDSKRRHMRRPHFWQRKAKAGWCSFTPRTEVRAPSPILPTSNYNPLSPYLPKI